MARLPRQGEGCPTIRVPCCEFDAIIGKKEADDSEVIAGDGFEQWRPI